MRILHLGVIFICSYILVSGCSEIDPISKLESRINSAKSSAWVNGISPKINLSQDAKPDQVLNEIFNVISFDKGRVTSFSIIEERSIELKSPGLIKYKAVLVDTNLGKKIVIYKYDGKLLGWWSKTFNKI